MLTAIIKWSVFVYGILLIALGLAGYVFANSTPSVVMGGSIGFLLIICSLLLFMEKRIGLLFATILTFATAGFFAYRYSTMHGLMAALLAVLSGAMLIILLLHYARWKKK